MEPGCESNESRLPLEERGADDAPSPHLIGAQDETKADPATGTGASTRYAIIPRGAPLRTTPDVEAPIVLMPAHADFPNNSPVRGPSRGTVVTVVGADGDFIEVETLVADPQWHCEGILDQLVDLRLRLYVPRDAPLWVTTRPVQHTAADGSTVRLPVGVPLRRADRPTDGWIASALGVRVQLPLPAEAVGRSYTAPPPPPSPVERGVLSPDAHLEYDGRSIHGRAMLLGQGTTIYGDRHDDDDGRLVMVRNECIEIEARTEAAPARLDRRTQAPRRREAGPSLPVSIVGGAAADPALVDEYDARGSVWAGLPREHHVRSGTTIYWRDGRVAGEVVRDHAWHQDPETEGSRPCFWKSLTADERYVELCFDARDVTIAVPTTTSRRTGPSPRGRTRVGTPSVVGGLSVESVRGVVQAHINEIRSCHNEGLRRGSSLEGTVSVDIELDAQGHVTESKVSSGPPGRHEVETCIEQAFARWQFPRSADGKPVGVTQPLSLSPP